MLFFVIALLAAHCISLYAAPAADEILSLPGWTGALPTKQYSGYLSLTSGSQLHYWFVASEKDPANAPTVLWLNGGPGCSSLDGFFYEMGPFTINTDGKTLSQRPVRWNQLVNMIYIENPVGVGFSYSSSSPPNYACDDDRTASELSEALSSLFTEKFPELINNPLFLSGESYSGIYTPTTAEAILKGTKDGSYTGATLKGIAVGNGCSGTEVGICCQACSQATYTEWKYLIETPFVSRELKEKVNSACDWPAAAKNEKNALSFNCVKLLNEASDAIENINLYSVYGDCTSGGCAAEGTESLYRSKVPMRSSPLVVVDPENPAESRKLQRIIPGGPNACIDSTLASAYLNQPAVMEAIHVKVPDGCWSVCSQQQGWSYNSTRTNLPRDTYPFLIESGLRVVIYNGAMDGCVPYTDGELWTSGMGLPVKRVWHAWKYTSLSGAQDQVAGYATAYDTSSLGGGKGSFEFVTINSGRHEVPESAPAQSLEMIQRLIDGTEF